jgi:hypothetical protein
MNNAKMVYGMGFNMHQVDEHTIQIYVLDAKKGEEGKMVHHPTTFESSAKHPDRVKSSGEPYAREHDNMFNLLKSILIREGKWNM